MVLSPYMLGIGIEPLVASALSGFCVLFSSTSTSFQFAMNDAIQYDHGVVVTTLSFVGALVGNIVLQRKIVNKGRGHIVIWIVFFILLVALFILPFQMYFELKTQTHFFETGRIC